MQNSIKAAVVQMNCTLAEPKVNLEKARRFIERAAKKDAKLVVLPELFDVGYDLKVIRAMNTPTDKTLVCLSEMAKEYDVYLSAGVLEQVANEKYNTIYVFDNSGAVMTQYRKISLFGEEKNIFRNGSELRSFEIDDFRFGLMNCYDIRFPEVSRCFCDLECNVLLISSAFPFARAGHWNALLMARAIENQAYVVASNRSGMESTIRFAGNSCVIDPWGHLETLDSSEENILVCELKLDIIKEVRTAIACLEDRDRLKNILANAMKN